MRRPGSGRGGARLRRLGNGAVGGSRPRGRLRRHVDRRPRLAAAVAATLTAIPAGLAEGPVAAVIAAVYAGAGATLLAHRRREIARIAGVAIAMDGFAVLTAHLRAGGDVGEATSAVLPGMRASGDIGQRLADRVSAACRVAEVTGARLADLLDRIEADARVTDRLRAIAAAQAGGAQATAWLLAGLPIGGIALGYGIGVDPLHVLLRTSVGALFAALAMAFQMAGLAWSQRLARQTRESI
jgi:tight adherence protein B